MGVGCSTDGNEKRKRRWGQKVFSVINACKRAETAGVKEFFGRRFFVSFSWIEFHRVKQKRK